MRLDNCSQFLRDNRCFEIKHISYIYKKWAALFCLWYGVESYGCPVSFIIVHKPRADIAPHLFLAFWAQLGTLCRKSMSTARRTPQVGYNSHQNSLYPKCSYIKERQKQCHIGDHVTTSPPPWRPIPQWLPDHPPPQSYTDLSHPRRPWWVPLCPRKCQLSPAYPKVTKCNQQSERPKFLLSLVLIKTLAGLNTLQALPILSSFDV